VSHAPSIGCSYLGCMKATREGKPYCSNHVAFNDHAAKVLGELAAMEIEYTKKKANATGMLANELMCLLRERNGCASKGRLARDMNVGDVVVERLLIALKKQGVVKLSKTNRGKVIAQLKKEAAA